MLLAQKIRRQKICRQEGRGGCRQLVERRAAAYRLCSARGRIGRRARGRNAMQAKACWRIGILSFALALSTAGAAGAADERKQLAFDVIERNAQQMTDISDALFYFGELGHAGIREHEAAQGHAGPRPASRSSSAAPTCRPISGPSTARGRPKIAIVTEIDALPGGSQTPGTYERKPLVKDGARPHGRPQHPRRCRVDGGVRREGSDAAPQHSRHGRDLVRTGRGAAREPAVSGARRLFQGRRRDHLPPYPRHADHRLRRCRTMPRSARSSPFMARPPTARSIRGTARMRSTRSS